MTTVRLLGYWRLELPEDDPPDNYDYARAVALGLRWFLFEDREIGALSRASERDALLAELKRLEAGLAEIDTALDGASDTAEVLVPVVRLAGFPPDVARMATIRRNRARDFHHAFKMADLVVELLEMGLSPEEIGRRLRMDDEEVDSGATAVAAIGERARLDERFRAEMLQWPDATMLVDPTWREDERRRVGGYLQRGTRVNQMRGLSLCRFCERHNGSAELTDGVYCWPEGLAHYVSEHDVRLPEEFVGHILSQPPVPPGLPQPSFDELGQRDRSWPGPSFAHLLWAPEGPRSDGLPRIKVDRSWWLQVTGMQGNA